MRTILKKQSSIVMGLFTLAFILLALYFYPAPPALAADGEVELFDNGNIYAVDNGPTLPTVFTLDNTYRITLITNYHWNYGLGTLPGSIGLQDSSGNSLGNWPAASRSGQWGAQNVYWDVLPDIVLG